MALNASTNWYVRAGGNALNGGGWDAAIAGAGINYADADAAILSPTDLATSGAVATVTSAAGGFTANMVGNCLRIASGTNFTPGYYFIVTFTDANTVILDRACATAAGSGGTGRIGGAFATPWGNLSNGGTVTAPTIATPLAPGHTIWVRGSGGDAPGSPDYNFGGNYATFPIGSTAGRIKLKGYNGRPRIDCAGLGFQSVTGWYFDHLSSVITAATYNVYGFISGGDIIVDVRVDQAGYDVRGLAGGAYFGCRFVNSGSSAAGTQPAIGTAGSNTLVYGTVVNGWRGPAIDNGVAGFSADLRIVRSVFAHCRATSVAAVRLTSAFALSYRQDVLECTFYGNAHDGLSVAGNTTYDAEVAGTTRLMNCIFAVNAGYGIRYTGTLALNDLLKGAVDYNAYFSNTLGDRYLMSAAPNDIALSADPFVDGPGGDFTLNSTAGGGADLRAAAFPESL